MTSNLAGVAPGQRRPLAQLPGPPPWALPRLALQGLRRPHELAVDLHRRFGPVVRLGAGRWSYVYLFGEDANRRILLDQPDAFRWREAFQALEPVVGPGALVLSDGEEHKRRRRLVQPAFSTRRVEATIPIVTEEVDRVIDTFEVGTTVDLYARYRAAVRRIVVRALFGDALAGRSDELGEVLEPAMRYVDRPPEFQVPVTLGWWRARRGRRAAARIVDAEIQRRRHTGDLGDDTLGALLATDLDHDEVRDQVLSLIAAGYETTASALGWVILELLRNPDEWNRCHAEVHTVLGPDPVVPSADDLRHLPSVTAAINEALRLWPPASISGRRTTETLTYAGHHIPAGTTVIYSPYVTHRDPDLWGHDAQQFHPSRWESHDPSPTAFIPFGGPYRRCIGFGLALTEIHVALIRLLQRTDLTLTDPHRSTRGTGVSALRPEHGVPVRVDRVRSWR